MNNLKNALKLATIQKTSIQNVSGRRRNYFG
jgi:hypothetical protein